MVIKLVVNTKAEMLRSAELRRKTTQTIILVHAHLF